MKLFNFWTIGVKVNWFCVCCYHPNAANDHYATSLGNIDDKMLAIGDGHFGNNKVEIFDIISNTWSYLLMSYPYCGEQ